MAPLRRALLLLLAVVAAVGLWAVVLAPAALVDARIAELTGGTVRLAVEGTVWQARGMLVAGATRTPIGWRIDPWRLLRGELRVHVSPDPGISSGAPRADVALSSGRVTLSDVDVTVPVALIASAMHSAAARTVVGDVNVTSSGLEWAPASLRGEARLHWRAARILLADGGTPLDLGDVSAVLSGGGDRLAGPVSNEGGDVAVRGRIMLRANEALGVTLSLVPRHPLDPTIAQVLSTVGAADADGWRLDWGVPLR